MLYEVITRTDVVAWIVNELGLEKVMFEAADPEVFGWYVKQFGPDVNLFVDHSQVVQLECVITSYSIHYTKLYEMRPKNGDSQQRVPRFHRGVSIRAGNRTHIDTLKGEDP